MSSITVKPEHITWAFSLGIISLVIGIVALTFAIAIFVVQQQQNQESLEILQDVRTILKQKSSN